MSVTRVPNPKATPIERELTKLLRMRLLVGIPSTAGNEPGSKAPLAVVAYVQEFGDIQLNIPPRPFLMPGVQNARRDIEEQMSLGAAAVLQGAPASFAEARLAAVGTVAVAAVKKRMTDGPFAPLSARTIEARARRRDKVTGKLDTTASPRNARQFLQLQAQGVPVDVLHDADFAKPLIDKGDLYRSIQSVVVKR